MLLRPLRRQFAKFSRVYENALQTNAIKEDPFQKNVVRYLDRFQDILEKYQRGKVPNYEIIKSMNGKQFSCGIYDNEEEARVDLMYLGKHDEEQHEFYIKPYLEPSTLSNAVQRRKVVTSSINQFPRLPTEVSRYRTFSQFNRTWKQPKVETPVSEPEKPAETLNPRHLTYKQLLELPEATAIPDRRGVMSSIPQIPRGIYLYGDVGTGKSYLMDLFYKTVSVDGGKIRVHFHEFMQDFHRQLHQYKQQQIKELGREDHIHMTSEKDAIIQVSKQIAMKNVLICFDEFHVTDIADALILSHIFETFYKCGSIVFATSNHAPDNLYMNGLNRMFFMPFIYLISTHSRVIDIASQTDYRKSLAHPVNDVIITPCGPAADDVLYGNFPQLSPKRATPRDLSLSPTRTIHIPAAVEGVCRIPFSQICGDDRGTDDYENLACHFHTIIVTDIPQLDVGQPSIVSRFVKMVDQFYDHRIRLIMTAATDVTHLFDRVFEKEREIAQTIASKKEMDIMEKGRLSAISSLVFSCRRTESRLVEMTGKDYLEKHAAIHN